MGFVIDRLNTSASLYRIAPCLIVVKLKPNSPKQIHRTANPIFVDILKPTNRSDDDPCNRCPGRENMQPMPSAGKHVANDKPGKVVKGGKPGKNVTGAKRGKTGSRCQTREALPSVRKSELKPVARTRKHFSCGKCGKQSHVSQLVFN